MSPHHSGLAASSFVAGCRHEKTPPNFDDFSLFRIAVAAFTPEASGAIATHSPISHAAK